MLLSKIKYRREDEIGKKLSTWESFSAFPVKLGFIGNQWLTMSQPITCLQLMASTKAEQQVAK